MNNYNWFQKYILSKYDWYNEENRVRYKPYSIWSDIVLAIGCVCVIIIQFLNPISQKYIGLPIAILGLVSGTFSFILIAKAGNIKKEDKIERKVVERLENHAR